MNAAGFSTTMLLFCFDWKFKTNIWLCPN